MNKKVLLIVIAWLSLVLTACDTRDDYFYEHCDEPTVTFTTSDSDSVTVSGKRYVQIVLNWNETKKVDFSLHDKYGGISDVQWKVTSFSTPYMRNGQPYSYIAYDSTLNEYTLDGSCIEFALNKENNSIEFTERLGYPAAKTDMTSKVKAASISNIYSENLDSTKIYLTGTFYNKLGVKGYTNVILIVRQNKAPKISITTKKIDSLEYQISANATDINGDNIVKYEYCIDGTTLTTSDSYYFEKATSLPGQAAVGGTYISETSLSSVNHAFQTKGIHNIYIRARDKWGLWSKWYLKTLNIE